MPHYLFLSVINSRGFHYDSKVSAWTDRERMAYDPVAKKFCIFLLHTQTVIFSVLVPLLQLDDKVNRLGVLHALHTEQGLYINDADAPQFDKMLGDVRGASNQGIIADPAYLHHVIRHQTVSPLNQFQGSLALADAAFSHNQHTFTEYIRTPWILIQGASFTLSQRMISAIRAEVVLSDTRQGTP